MVGLMSYINCDREKNELKPIECLVLMLNKEGECLRC